MIAPTSVSAVIAAAPPPPAVGNAAPKGGLLGLLPDLNRDPIGFFVRLAQDFGDFVPVRLGLTPCVVVSHPDFVEEVLVTRNHDYRKGHSTRRLASLLGKGLLLSEGDFWLRQRRLMQPAFHRQRLARMAQTMIDATQAMLACWRPGEVRNVNQEMMELTLRIVARTLFSTEVDEDLDRIRNANSTTNEHFRSRLFTLMTVLPDRVPTPGNVRYQRGLRSLHVLVERIVRERRASGEPGDDLLGMLLSARDEAGQGMTDRQLRDEVLTLLEAGHDTTALALTWSFVLLAQHPEEDERLFSDTLRVIGNRPPRVEDAPQLTYADHIVSETLRLRPTAWAINREAVRDTLVGGQRVPRGTTVLISPWVLHRDPRFWDEPDSFVPDRWSNGGPAKRFAYIPFGAGQRICIGAAFAQLEATLLLAGIVRCYRLALADPAARVEAWPVVTLRTREDVQMRLSPRTGSF